MTKDLGASASPTGLSSQATEPCGLGPVGLQSHCAVLACYDCGLPYGGPHWVEAVVPHDIWNNHLSPTGNEGGILCINCMAARASAKGLSNVPVLLTAGPFVGSDG